MDVCPNCGSDNTERHQLTDVQSPSGIVYRNPARSRHCNDCLTWYDTTTEPEPALFIPASAGGTLFDLEISEGRDNGLAR